MCAVVTLVTCKMETQSKRLAGTGGAEQEVIHKFFVELCYCFQCVRLQHGR